MKVFVRICRRRRRSNLRWIYRGDGVPFLAKGCAVFFWEGFGWCWHPRGACLVLVLLVGVLVFARASANCFCFRFRWHPRIVSVLQASPLCGAAPTFLCRRKEK